ncbi:MAG: GTPase Era, partial [Bacteroidales bacterium]|nr:GTPase Era [Bacteroidales bacterium]
FVNIIGNPNVGKSTLMNALVGEKLSIITSKAQTTRHRIMGIVNGIDFQIIYSDTPGIIKPHYKLHESMMKFIETALIDADIILLVTEVNDKIKDIEILKKIEKLNIPILVLINKIDLSDQQTIEEQIKLWKSRLKKADVIPISALEKFNIKKVFDKIIEKLPENPPFFPKDELTDKSQRFFVSEIIREKILLNYSKEIPYSIEVVVDEFKEDKNLIRIKAYIYVARDSQKAIIIGHKGNAIKKVGTEARIDIEDFIEKKVYLELSVKVNKDWRNKESQLKRFGYIN